MKNERGQIILILVLVMTVALAIGISVIQRSLSDISTASKVEQSSRAFSAAEAGIENKLSGGSGNISFTENGENGAVAQVAGGDLIPVVPSPGTQQNALEYTALAKEEVAHVWLADPGANLPNCAASDVCYKQPNLDIYWGNSATDQTALELTLVYHESGKYNSKKLFLKQPTKSSGNNFEAATCTGGYSLAGYQCRTQLASLPAGLMLIRARFLDNTSPQPFAVQAIPCPAAAANCRDYSIPPQARILTSTGTSGSTQRSVKLFQIDKVVPPYFDYAIFSTGDINK